MASTSVPGAFGGSPCPMEIRFGYVQGTAPATGEVKLPGTIAPAIGSLQTVNIGPSVFVGFVIGQEYDLLSDTTTVHLVDWRDRLHDVHIACVLNFQEDDGRIYHILPSNWLRQRKTFVTRELGQSDFDQFQRFPQLAFSSIQIAQNNLFSAATILDFIGASLGFVITADSMAMQRLMQTYPLNLDWNNGSTKIIDAIQQVMGKCGTQFTCYLAGIDALPFGNLVPKEAAPRDGFQYANLSRPVVKLYQPQALNFYTVHTITRSTESKACQQAQEANPRAPAFPA